MYLYSLPCRFSAAINTKLCFFCFSFFFLSYPGHLCAAVTDAAGTGVGKLLRAFTRRPVNYGRSRGRGGGKEEEEEGEPSLYLSGVTGVTGLSCMSGAPVFNHRRGARRLFSAAASSLTPPGSADRSASFLSDPAAESANEWAPEDLPAGPSVITQEAPPGPSAHELSAPERFLV